MIDEKKEYLHVQHYYMNLLWDLEKAAVEYVTQGRHFQEWERMLNAAKVLYEWYQDPENQMLEDAEPLDTTENPM